MSRWTESDFDLIQSRRLDRGKPILRIAAQAGGKGPGAVSKGEEAMSLIISHWGAGEPIREYRFHPKRRWRFDFAWPHHKAAIEVEGIHFDPGKAGRHQRGAGFEGDCEKYLAAQDLGWTVVRIPTTWLAKPFAAKENLDAARRVIERCAKTYGDPK